MREYAKVSPQFWVWVRQEGLGPDEILVALYLLTCPASNMFGMYYLVIEEMAHYLFGRAAPLEETFTRASQALREVSERGFCRHDYESGMVWIRNMAGWQVLSDWEPLKKTDNRVKNVNREYQKLPDNPFLSEIFDKYSAILHLEKRRAYQGAPKPLARGPNSEPGPLAKQEQDQEQEQEQEISSGGVSLANREAAERIPIRERCEALTKNPHMAEWCEPHRWPEIVRVATELAQLTKSTPRLSQYHRDSGVRALVDVFAAGFAPDEVCALLPTVVASRYWTESTRGLSSLTAEVLRRAEAGPTQVGGGVAQLTAREAGHYS
jgi:hypothetical protein